jgi:hypothetical protein
MRLLSEWKQAWRWYSVNCNMMTVAFLGAWATLPDTFQNSFSPTELKMIAIVLVLLSVGGRLVDQTKTKPSEPAVEGISSNVE